MAERVLQRIYIETTLHKRWHDPETGAVTKWEPVDPAEQRAFESEFEKQRAARRAAAAKAQTK